MDHRVFAAQLREEIEEIRSGGATAVGCRVLIEFLAEVEIEPVGEGDNDDSRVQAALDRELQNLSAYNKNRLHTRQTVIATGQTAIRALMLLNGGACIALLALVGRFIDVEPGLVPSLAGAMMPFVFGAFTAGLVAGGTYLSQGFWSGGLDGWAKGFAWATIALGVVSFASFFVGTLWMYGIFVNLPAL